jgi:arabinose-5-phosphate isomerase
MTFDSERALRLACETLDIEGQALQSVRHRLTDAFAHAVALLLTVKGRVVVMGMGKSGHIGRKVAATLASTGSPAMFVHPAEASHGDLGMITAQDAVLALSNSGESAEITAILPLVKRLGAPLLAITGGADSTLARQADVVLDSRVEREACPLGLAPTASTVAQLALGDALAVALLDARGFKAEDFARSHPGGALGRRLLTHVADVMRQGDAVPHVLPSATFSELMREMTHKGLGASAVVDAAGRVLGIFTDGDLRRLVETGRDLRALTAGEVLHAEPRCIAPEALAAQAAARMEQARITVLLVTDADDKLVGALNSNDLMRAKVI